MVQYFNLRTSLYKNRLKSKTNFLRDKDEISNSWVSFINTLGWSLSDLIFFEYIYPNSCSLVSSCFDRSLHLVILCGSKGQRYKLKILLCSHRSPVTRNTAFILHAFCIYNKDQLDVERKVHMSGGCVNKLIQVFFTRRPSIINWQNPQKVQD